MSCPQIIFSPKYLRRFAKAILFEVTLVEGLYRFYWYCCDGFEDKVNEFVNKQKGQGSRG